MRLTSGDWSDIGQGKESFGRNEGEFERERGEIPTVQEAQEPGYPTFQEEFRSFLSRDQARNIVARLNPNTSLIVPYSQNFNFFHPAVVS